MRRPRMMRDEAQETLGAYLAVLSHPIVADQTTQWQAAISRGYDASEILRGARRAATVSGQRRFANRRICFGAGESDAAHAGSAGCRDPPSMCFADHARLRTIKSESLSGIQKGCSGKAVDSVQR